jgi:Tol biopolymer transport system component
LNADGSKVEQLSACAQASTPCDFISAAPSPQRTRVQAIRTTPSAEAGASTLYFMDLSRSVEKMLFPRRRVDSVDWSPDGSFILFAAGVAQTNQADLFYSLPDGTSEQNLTSSATVQERNPRIDPFGRTAAFERNDEFGVSRIFLFEATQLTSGTGAGPALPDTPYVVGGDADPVISPDGLSVAFRRLTGTGNGGLGTWDILTLKANGTSEPQVIVTGAAFRGAPDWGTKGILFVETDAATSRSQIVRVQPDGSGRTVLRSEDAGYRMGSPRWLAGS